MDDLRFLLHYLQQHYCQSSKALRSRIEMLDNLLSVVLLHIYTESSIKWTSLSERWSFYLVCCLVSLTHVFTFYNRLKNQISRIRNKSNDNDSHSRVHWNALFIMAHPLLVLKQIYYCWHRLLDTTISNLLFLHSAKQHALACDR